MVPKDPKSPLSLLGTDGREPSSVCWSLHHCRGRLIGSPILLMGSLLPACFPCLAWPVEWKVTVISTCTGSSLECWPRPDSQGDKNITQRRASGQIWEPVPGISGDQEAQKLFVYGRHSRTEKTSTLKPDPFADDVLIPHSYKETHWGPRAIL